MLGIAADAVILLLRSACYGSGGEIARPWLTRTRRIGANNQDAFSRKPGPPIWRCDAMKSNMREVSMGELTRVEGGGWNCYNVYQVNAIVITSNGVTIFAHWVETDCFPITSGLA